MSGQRKRSSFDQQTASSLMKTKNAASNNQTKKTQGQSSKTNSPVSPTAETKSLQPLVEKDPLVLPTKSFSLPPSISTKKGHSSPARGGQPSSASSSPLTPNSPRSPVIKSHTGKFSKKKTESPVKQTSEPREPIHPAEKTSLNTSDSLKEEINVQEQRESHDALPDIQTRSVLVSLDGSEVYSAFSNESASLEPVTMIENQAQLPPTSRNNESLIENSEHSKSTEDTQRFHYEKDIKFKFELELEEDIIKSRFRLKKHEEASMHDDERIPNLTFMMKKKLESSIRHSEVRLEVYKSITYPGNKKSDTELISTARAVLDVNEHNKSILLFDGLNQIKIKLDR